MAIEKCVVIESTKCPQSSILIVPCLVPLAMSLCLFLCYLAANPPPIQHILVTWLWVSWNGLLHLTERQDTIISAGPPAANDCFRNIRTPLTCPQFCSALRNLVWDTEWLNEYMVIVHTNSNYPLKMSQGWQTLPSHFSRLYSKRNRLRFTTWVCGTVKHQENILESAQLQKWVQNQWL